MVSEERGAEMFDGMDLSRVHDRLVIGACHTDVEGRDRRVPGHVSPGNIDAGEKAEVVDGEAGDFFHKYISFHLPRQHGISSKLKLYRFLGEDTRWKRKIFVGRYRR